MLWHFHFAIKVNDICNSMNGKRANMYDKNIASMNLYMVEGYNAQLPNFAHGCNLKINFL